MLQAVSLVAFLTFKIDFNKNTETVTFLIPSQWTSILIITRWKRNKGFDESRFSYYPLSWESSGMVERIKNLLFGIKQLKKREVIHILSVIETLPKEHVDKVCYVLNVKQQFKVDAPMQIFPFWSPKILPLNLDVFL